MTNVLLHEEYFFVRKAKRRRTLGWHEQETKRQKDVPGSRKLPTLNAITKPTMPTQNMMRNGKNLSD